MTERWICLDTETTGLVQQLKDARPAKLLEVAMVAVELPTFTIVDEINVVLGFRRDQPDAPAIHVRVHQMHEQNGLWLDCEKSCIDLFSAQQMLCDFVLKHDAQGSPLMGCVPSFDRRFLEFWMPDLVKLFHYRDFDVNAFWMLDQVIRGEEATRAKHQQAHRALDDAKRAVQNVHDHFEFVSELVKGAG